ncbi:MAG: hypothetical protein RBS49_00700 [Sphaerochaeta sp.]|jgi:hypothetical protein|nr:hypothetical protein [Sphaerochaeta sp.]MDX9914379.1 hypothetical protein [Sphaerochaeta sp.]
MRKTVLVLLVMTLVLVPVSAKNSFAAGVNLGSNAGLGFQYRLSDFDLVGNIGYGFFDGYLSVDAAASYKVTDFKIEQAAFDVTVGGGAYVGIPVSGAKSLGLAVIVPVGLKYSLDNPDLPLDFYLRLAPGYWIKPTPYFYMGGYIGALWRFN